MADTNVNPPLNRTGTAPKPGPDNRRSDEDDEVDAALDAALGKELDEPERLVQAAVGRRAASRAGRRPGRFRRDELRRRRRPRSGKSAGPRNRDSDRGQEGRPGARTGKVIGVRGKCIFVDLGGKSEGDPAGHRFRGRSDCPRRARRIEVVVERFDPEEGVQILRLKGAAIEADWDNLKKGVTVEARVTKTIKGGLEVDVDGIRGFLPISQIDLSRVEDAASYVNQKFKAIVTEANQREKNLVDLAPRAAGAGAGRAAREDLGHARRRPGSRWRRPLDQGLRRLRRPRRRRRPACRSAR